MIRFFQNIWKRSKSIYKYYKSIDYVPIFNFFKVIETDDKRFLLKLEDYELLPDVVDLTELNKAWNGIELQYSKAEDSNSSIIQFTTAKGVCKMELEYLMLWNIHNLMIAENNGPNTKECLKRAGLQDKDLKWIEKRIKSLTNRINLKRQSIKEQNPENTKFDFWRIIDEIEDIKGRAIDITKTTVRQYIAIMQNIKKNGQRQNRKK